MQYELATYTTEDNQVPYEDYMASLRDRRAKLLIASGLSFYKYRIEALQFYPRLIGCKLPINFGSISISLSLPIIDHFFHFLNAFNAA